MSRILKIILGPTAVGKSSYSISVAKKYNAPIVNCDSRQIYKELNIGTAKPTAEQMQGIPHYLISTHSITEHYTAGKYELEALELLNKLFEESEIVILCGGSGLYIDALCKGIDPFPAPDLALREKLSNRLESEGLESLQKSLKELDPESYDIIDICNPQRVIRALEVTIQTSIKFSEWKTGENKNQLPCKSRDFEIQKIGLNRSREELYDRIDHRVDLMMEEGLLDEVKSLDSYRYVSGELRRDLLHIPALRTVGYRELFDYIDGIHSLDKAVELIKRNTRRYAKRQLTWWRRDKEIEWINL